MNQRRSAAGRPTGTDGYDFSYRMVVDSRYTKVAKQKSRLSSLLLIQGLVSLVGVAPILLQVAKGEDPNVLSLSSAIVGLLSLVVGEIGRRQSRTAFLKIYLIVSFVTMLLSIACSVKSNIIVEVIQSGVASCWETKKLQLIQVLHLFMEVLVKTGAGITTLSLIHNMSPPKKSS